MAQPEQDIPNVLYHLTTDERLPQILAEGKLRPGADPFKAALYQRETASDPPSAENVFFADSPEHCLRLSGKANGEHLSAIQYNNYYNSNWKVFSDLVKTGRYKWAKFGVFYPVLVIPTDWIGEITSRANPFPFLRKYPHAEYLHKGEVVLPEAPKVIQVKAATVKHLVRVDRPTVPLIPPELARPVDEQLYLQAVAELDKGIRELEAAFDSIFPELANANNGERVMNQASKKPLEGHFSAPGGEPLGGQLTTTDTRQKGRRLMATRSPWHTRRTIRNAGYTVQMNFSGNDLFLTFGYVPGREPRKKATGRGLLITNIIRPLKDSRAAAGVPFRYCYSTKWGPDGTPPEHRLILSAGPETAEQLAARWPYGPVVIHPLREMGNLSGLVARLYNEAMETAEPGENLITFSHDLRRPG